MDGASLVCRRWDDECVVHHALSNDTHRLTSWAGQLLMALEERRALTTDELAARLNLEPTDVDAALLSLAQLELVRQC